MNEEYRSPEYLQMSPAGALTNDPEEGRSSWDTHINFLELQLTYPEGCQAICSYCGFSTSGHRHVNPGTLVQTWPILSVDEIISRVNENTGSLERICLSMVVHPDGVEDTTFLIDRFRRETDLKVSVLVNPSLLNDGDIEAFHVTGADRAIVAIETATRDLFNQHGGMDNPHQWEKYWLALGDAAAAFGGDKTGTHLIAGLGETEQQMVNTIQRARDLGASTYLFSFFPDPGSILKNAEPCPSGQFRRIQLARFLIDCSLVVDSQMDFDEHERITGFGLRGTELDDIVDTGEPFTASGCPGKTMNCACNRPYADGPAGDIRSYPFCLEPEDIQQVRKQMATYLETPSFIDQATIQGILATITSEFREGG
jgi:biotin synthase